MTGCCTEPLTTPAYQTAACLLQQLSSFLFRRANDRLGGAVPGETTFEAWWSLRMIAETFLRNRSVLLKPEEAARLNGALQIAHEDQHKMISDVTASENLPGNVDDCPCWIAGTLRKFAEVLEQGKAESCRR